jgi:hypothetical protein
LRWGQNRAVQRSSIEYRKSAPKPKSEAPLSRPISDWKRLDPPGDWEVMGPSKFYRTAMTPQMGFVSHFRKEDKYMRG